MVKTTSPAPETRFGTLSNVVDQLKQTNQLLDRQGSSLNTFIKEQSKAAALGKKDKLESGREGKKGGKIMGAARMGVRGVGEISGINPAARGLSMLLAPIMSGIGVLLKPLKFLSKLLLRGGPIGLLITGMYVMFKDIADNPTFNAVIDSIKKTWSESIVPTFNSIKESVDALMGNEDVKATFESIKNWFSNFKTQIQDWVLGNLKIITDTIAGVLEGVDLLLKGDWKAGISTIGTTLFNGIKNFFDNAMTNLLEMFGVDFGEGGSFLGSVGEIIDSLLINMVAKWNEFKKGIKDTWAILVNFFTGDDGYIKTTIANIKEAMSNKWNDMVTSIKDRWTGMATGIKTKVSDLLTPLTVDLPNKIGEIKDGLVDTWNTIKSKIMEALTKTALWFMFKPRELGLLLEEKWIETKGKFMERLANFAGMLATLPAQLKLGLLESVKGTFLGKYLVDDEAIAAAKADVNSGQAFANSLMQASQSKTQEDLARIRKDRISLEMDKIRAERAATNIVQQISGGTTVNTTNLNPNTGSVADPYASSYMGHALPGGY